MLGYTFVIFILAPFLILTGIAMAPAHLGSEFGCLSHEHHEQEEDQETGGGHGDGAGALLDFVGLDQ